MNAAARKKVRQSLLPMGPPEAIRTDNSQDYRSHLLDVMLADGTRPTIVASMDPLTRRVTLGKVAP
jgi:hypothetical protein